MKALVVRVHKAEIKVREKIISSIKDGIVLFLGIAKKDTDESLLRIADKVVNLRIFEDEKGKLQFSLKEKNCSLMCISNFTLCANTNKGRRPSFEEVMCAKDAREIFDNFVVLLRSKGIDVKEGIFGEHMEIDLEMDGPLNIVLSD